MRKKLKKFEANKHFTNLLQKDDPNIKQKIQSAIKNQTVILELGCGKGEYSLSLAQKHPDKFFVGIDIQGERLHDGAKLALENNLINILFLRVFIDNLEQYFPSESVDEIWLTFPDPFPRLRQTDKRLTSNKFLKKYQTLLKTKHCIHLKTDNENMFNYSQKSIKAFGGQIIHSILNVHQQPESDEDLKITTYFEQKYLSQSKPIYYFRAKLT